MDTFARPLRTSYLQADMTAWRRDFHRHPELGFAEKRTSEAVARLLADFGLEVRTGIGGSGVVGILRRGSGPAIGLRADMDALPINERNDFSHRSSCEGVFHGCGHDGHMSMLLGAAKHLAASGRFAGTACFIFQPAEEWGKGALAMIRDGLFDAFPVRDVYGMHNWPSLREGCFAIRPGAMMAAEDNFTITIRGRGGHASAPHLCRDPLVAGAEIVTALQTIASRSADPAETCVVSATELITDGARNILPSTVTIKGDARTFSDASSRMVERRMGEIVAGICAAHGVEGTLDYTHEFAVLVNEPDHVRWAVAAARETVGAENVDADVAPKTGSEDFAWMLKEKPGAYILIGAGSPSGDAPCLHNPYYDFPDSVLPIGADYWTRLVEIRLPAGA